MNETFYKRMFYVGAWWNIGGGVFIILATGWIFSSAGLSPPEPPVYYYSWIALFMAFGIGYFMVYRDMYGNKNIVILGIVGKLAFSIIFIVGLLTLAGQIPTLFWIPVVGDIVFVVLYWMFLNFAKKRSR